MSLNFIVSLVGLWLYGIVSSRIASIMFAGGRRFISSFFIKSMYGAA